MKGSVWNTRVSNASLYDYSYLLAYPSDFDNFSMVSSASLLSCSSSPDQQVAQDYLAQTADFSGVVVFGTSYTRLCQDGFWWKSPACRIASRCIPYITYSQWRLAEAMMKARSAV